MLVKRRTTVRLYIKYDDMLAWIIANYVELIGATLGLLFLYLEIKENVWLWPVGLLSSAFYVAIFFSAKFDCRLSVLSRTACACCPKIFLSDMSKSVFFASSLPGLAANPMGRKNNQPFGTGGIKGKINKILILKFEAI